MSTPPVIRKIIHVDMDAFYASVEQRDQPDLRGKPVAVGGRSKRGVVAAASYEARQFGVHSALPSQIALRRCPHIVFIKPRFEVYRAISRQIRTIFESFSPLVEPLSLDEAFLDVTDPLRGPPSATLIARMIKREIRSTTGLTASAGVSYNKFLAKVASAAQKPDGLTVITPDEAASFLAALPIEKFFGVGPATAARMHRAQIRTGADLQGRDESELVRLFGKAGRWWFRAARGIDDRAVRPDRIRKSLGAERTFFDDLITTDAMLERVDPICDEVIRRMEGRVLGGHTVTLKIRVSDFTTTTRQLSMPQPVTDSASLKAVVHRLLLDAYPPPDLPVRLLGVTLSKLRFPDDPDAYIQLRLPLEAPVVPDNEDQAGGSSNVASTGA